MSLVLEAAYAGDQWQMCQAVDDELLVNLFSVIEL
jgi:hypothetical protein